MKSFTNRDQNRIKTCEPFKFKKIIYQQTKQKALKPVRPERRYLPDKENMHDKIQELKEENTELNELIKIQQTQINYFKEQEKRLVDKNCQNSSNELAKLRIRNIRMADKIETLSQQVRKLKRTVKFTNIKELQHINEKYLDRIKELTAKIQALNQDRNIEELNRIIENQYYLGLKNRKLEEEVKMQKGEILKNIRLIRKQGNIMMGKDKQIKELKQNMEELSKNEGKRKNICDYVHKSELVEKKKQVMSLTEGIEMLERKLWECENKIQILEAENIENINREAMKRKELLNNYENLKKNNEILEDSLIQALRKSNENNNNSQQIWLDKLTIRNNDNEIKKIKNPLVVHLHHVRETVDEIIYTFQKHSISSDEAIEILCGEQESLSIRQLMCALNSEPLNIHCYQKKELLARYIIEDNSSHSELILFDEPETISIVKSILKKILNNYRIFNKEEEAGYKLKVLQFYKAFGFEIRANLATAMKEVQKRSSFLNDGKFSKGIIVDAFQKQNILNEDILNYISYRSFELGHQRVSLEDFLSLFSVQANPTFLTEEQSLE